MFSGEFVVLMVCVHISVICHCGQMAIHLYMRLILRYGNDGSPVKKCVFFTKQEGF
jgi:hypothetical protein